MKGLVCLAQKCTFKAKWHKSRKFQTTEIWSYTVAELTWNIIRTLMIGHNIATCTMAMANYSHGNVMNDIDDI